MLDDPTAERWLALDPGGSKCAALSILPDGTVERFVEVHAHGRGGRDAAVVWDAVERVVADAPPTRLHVATTGFALVVAHLRDRLQERGNLVMDARCVGEGDAALALAGEKSGIVALAGTGSFVEVHAADGTRFRLDGLGPLLGDTGSAYHIGWMAARAAALAAQHRRYATALRAKVFEKLGIPSLGGLITWSLHPSDRSVVASLARLVDDAAEAGDPTAIRILRTAAEELASHVADIAEAFDLGSDRPCPVVATGSVLQRSALYWDHWCRELATRNRLLRPIRTQDAPVLGVALAARAGRGGGADGGDAALRQRIIDSFRSLKPSVFTFATGDNHHA